MQVVQVSQLGKVAGNKIQLGEFKRIPAPDVPGKFTSVFRMTRKKIALGDGVDLVEAFPDRNTVLLNVTAEAALRHGWPHPANKPAPNPADLGRLQGIATSEEYGAQERIDAIEKIREIDPARAATLSAALGWLWGGA